MRNQTFHEKTVRLLGSFRPQLKPYGRPPRGGFGIVALVLIGLMAALGSPFGQISAFANPIVVFGPQKFERSTGKPIQEVVNFSVQNPNGAYTLRIDNGGLAGNCLRVSSAVVLLNGVKVLGPKDFNQGVQVIEQAVTLQADNELIVEVRSLPDSCLTLQIMGDGVNAAPVADAGPDQTVLVNDPVTLDGSGSSDVDGDILTFQWTIIQQPSGSSATLSNPTAVMPTFFANAAGEYRVQLIVNDGTVDSAPDDVVITTGNSPPVADAGPDQTVLVNDPVTLDGSGSSDVDGDPLTFAWSFTSVPAGSTATLSDPTAVMPTFTVDVAGTYVVQLIVNDGTVDSAPDDVVITTGNSPPVADAGPDQTVLVNDPVTLDGSGSSDVDGDPLTFAWSFTSVPAGSTATLSDPTAVMPTFTVDVAGTYVVQLIVNDGTVDSAPDDVVITTGNSPPVADAGPDQTVLVNDTVTLDGSGSSDVDGDPLTFAWSFTSVPAGSTATLSDPTAVMPTFTVDVAGTYVVQLIVNDGTVDSAPDDVVITTGNSPPVADAGPDQTVLVNDTVTLDGSGSSDVDGDPLTFAWSFTSVPAGSTATLSDPTAVMPTFTVDVAGTYVVQLIVNDGTVDSAPDDVVITTGNSPPVADAGPDQTVLVNDTVTLDGSGSSDVDGDPLTFAWSFTSVPAGSTATLSDPTAVMPTFTVDVAGTYVVQLIVNDGTVDSAPDTVVIQTIQGQGLQCGDLLSGSIDAAGEEDVFTFPGTAGQVIDLTLVETSNWGAGNAARGRLLSPSGAQVGQFDSNAQQMFTLPESGTYIVRINANNLVATGPYNIGMECRHNPVAVIDDTLSCGGLVSGTIGVPGEVDLITFQGTAGQVIDLTLVEASNWAGASSVNDARATLFAPSGAQVGQFDSNAQQTFTLPESGTYIVRINANNLVATGLYNIGMECRHNPVAVIDDTLSCGGLVSGTIGVPGEVDLITFQGTAGQVIDLTLVETSGWIGLPSGLTDAQGTLFAPSGAQVGQFDSNAQQTFTLPESGTYIVRINANNVVSTGALAVTGSYNLGMECRHNPVAVIDDTLSCGGLVSGTIGVPGEVDLITFQGTAGQVIDLTLVETSVWVGAPFGGTDARGTLFTPSGVQIGQFDSNIQETFVLSESGTYMVRVNANDLLGTGDYDLGLECP